MSASSSWLISVIRSGARGKSLARVGAWVGAGLASFLCGAATYAAPPKLTGLFPAGVARGQTATVTAAGDFSAWPVEAWVDRPGLTVTVEADKGKLKIAAAADAAPGVYWLRLTHAEGATTLRPFVVGTLPEVEEVEPNDAPEKPQVIAGSTVVNGKLGKGGDVDSYALRLRKGESLTAVLEANVPLGSPLDGLLQIAWLSGPNYDDATPTIPTSPTSSRRLDAFVLEQDDDAAGFDPRVSFVAPRDGWYAVRCFGFPTEPNATVGFAGADTYVYRLTISTGGAVENAWPLAAPPGQAANVRFLGWNLPPAAAQDKSIAIPARDPSQVGVFEQVGAALDGTAGAATLRIFEGASLVAADTSDPKTPQPITIPSIVSGRIEAPGDVDAFSFTATKGQRLKFSVEARGLGFPLDPILFVTDAAGKQLAENDDAGKGRDPELVFAAPADGQYAIVIRDVHRHGGTRYLYRLATTVAGQDYALTLAADAFVLAAGKPLEIPVTIERRDGMDQPIEVSVLGLPAGVTAPAVVSEPKGDSAKAVKLILNADAAAKFAANGASMRIIGKVAAEPARFRLATFVTGAAPATHQDVWLTLPR